MCIRDSVRAVHPLRPRQHLRPGLHDGRPDREALPAAEEGIGEQPMATETRRVIKLKVEPLTAEAYAPYGALVDAGRLQLHCSDGQYTARLMALEPASARIPRV